MSFCELCMGDLKAKGRNAGTRRAATAAAAARKQNPRQTKEEPPRESSRQPKTGNRRPLRGQADKPGLGPSQAANRKKKASRVRPKTRNQACQTPRCPIFCDYAR
ncbi:uncharacterized protein LOC135429335 [Drosophila montana]|uniref:uncharacterized protein LOC135429335 n=1 Tax=Drosophila montana TaxID=40370 RepID=UPI00313F3A4C